MTRDELPGKLPRDWLPDPVGRGDGDDAAAWHRRLNRLMARAEPRLVELGRIQAPWWEVLAGWWRPATVSLAAGAALASLLTFLAPAPDLPRSPTLVLDAVATDGAPAALWAGMGQEADPVLALIVLEGGGP